MTKFVDSNLKFDITPSKQSPLNHTICPVSSHAKSQPLPSQDSNNKEQALDRRSELQCDQGSSATDSDEDNKQGSDNLQQIEGTNQKDQAESMSVAQIQKPVTTSRSKKCFNALCKNYKIYKRIKSRIQTSKYRSLCKTCHTNYMNNQFCEFCEQIYDNTVNEDDDINWIGCDTCQRWNHISCEVACRLKDAHIIKQQNGRYECQACTAKSRQKTESKRVRQQSKQDQDTLYGYQRGKKKTSRQVVNEQKNLVYINQSKNYINIFNRVRQPMPSMDQFFHNLNYKLAISDEQIKQDLNRFRTILSSPRITQANIINGQSQEEDQQKKKRRKK